MTRSHKSNMAQRAREPRLLLATWGNPITIDAPNQLMLNVWTSEHWVNGPPEQDVPCTYLIDWIRFIPQG